MGAVGAGAGEFVGGVLGDIAGAGDRARARRYWQDLQDLGPSAYDQIATDPRLRDAQMTALDRLSREGSAGGMGVEDRVALAQAQGETARRERGSREAILQGMAMRGQGGSGVELAATLANQQGAAEQNAMSGAQAAADARRRALSATMQSGQLGGSIRGQDYGEKANRASATDAIARFNADQRMKKAAALSGMALDDSKRWSDRGAGAGSFAGSFF